MSYIIALLVTYNLICAWFFSNFTAHVYSRIAKEKMYCRDDVLNHLLVNGHDLIADWYNCPMCAGTWICFVVCAVTAIITSNYWLMLYGTFSIPAICFTVMKKLDLI